MKFWKILRKLRDEIFPDWQDKFISYKDLKKQLKSISPPILTTTVSKNDQDQDQDQYDDDDIDGGGGDNSTERQPSKRAKRRRRLGDYSHEVSTWEMKEFVNVLEAEIKKFNLFFMDKEEEYIIRFKMLKDDVAEAEDSKQDLMKVGRKMVDFHGEMVLLENYSALNYTGLLKILKKYDKRSGDLIRLPFIQKVLHEPFFRTEVINKLVKECEIMIYQIFSLHKQLVPPEDTDQKEGWSERRDPYVNIVSINQPPPEEETEKCLVVPEELAEIKCMENLYLRLTISALRTMKELRSGSSTVSIFSLPPMQGSVLDETHKLKDPVVEAK